MERVLDANGKDLPNKNVEEDGARSRVLWLGRYDPQKFIQFHTAAGCELHAPRHHACIGALQIAIARQRPQREEF
jgi:hypothetical protein